MLENKDRIAQPAQDRFFPVTVAGTIKVLRDLGFASPTYCKRIDIIFRNEDTTGPYGRIVAAFFPAEEMIIYSVSEDLDRQRARVLLQLAFQEFAELEQDVKSSGKHRASLQAYYSQEGKLVITKRIRRARFDITIKPKSLEKDELVVRSLDLI